jgi:Chitin synthase
METKFIVLFSIGGFILLNIFIWILYLGLSKKMKEDTQLLGKIYTMKKFSFISAIFLLNVGLCVISFLFNDHYHISFYVVLFMKTRDIITTCVWIMSLLIELFRYCIHKCYGTQPIKIDNKTIVSIIPVYSESQEQIERTITSISENEIGTNKNLLCIICDGINVSIESSMDMIIKQEEVTYNTWKLVKNTIDIMYCVYKKIPCVIMKKRTNQGKKDTIIMGNDIFNYPRDTLGADEINLRNHIRTQITELYKTDATSKCFENYDYMFFTDADSIITKNSFLDMLETIETRKANACCGLVVIDFINSNWSFWNLFQNYQYLYGQHIRRGCENLIGTVTCMPGCITMFKVCPVASNAMKLYSTLPSKNDLIKNCVQMFGTDRRLASSYLYQSSDITHVVDYRAKCFTIPPDNFYSYVSQRRRWGSNSYFNQMYNLVSPHINPFIRLLCLFDTLRFSLEFFRMYCTCMFLYNIVCAIISKNDAIVNELIPAFSILLFPTISFFIYTLFNSFLRRMLHKLILGYLMNKICSFYITMVVIINVFWHMGNTKWSGANNPPPPPPPSSVVVINVPEVPIPVVVEVAPPS